MRGSRYAEIIEEAQLVTKVCIKNALNRKAFAKALFRLKAVNEALEHLLLELLCEKKKFFKHILHVCSLLLIH